MERFHAIVLRIVGTVQAIVITFDRLATRLLGCYGNEWIETPRFDRLASTSVLFENHFTDTVGPSRGQSFLTGRHALIASTTASGLSPLQLLSDAGVARRILVSENATLWPFISSLGGECQVVNGTEGLDALPAEVSFARLVQAGIKSLSDSSFDSKKRLLWLHASEPGLPPEGFATLYFDDFKDRELSLEDIPRGEWHKQMAVAAGSVSLIDHWLGVLLDELQTHDTNQPTLIIVAGATGRAWIDDFNAASATTQRETPAVHLRDQQVRSPLIMAACNDDRFSNHVSLRCRQFTQPTDFVPTLLDWFGLPVDQKERTSLLQVAMQTEPVREAVIYGDEASFMGIRTTEWGCVTRVSDLTGSSDRQTQLFIKPEDVWDMTDMSTQYPEVCEQLLAKIDSIRNDNRGSDSGRA